MKKDEPLLSNVDRGVRTLEAVLYFRVVSVSVVEMWAGLAGLFQGTIGPLYSGNKPRRNNNNNPCWAVRCNADWYEHMHPWKHPEPIKLVSEPTWGPDQQTYCTMYEVMTSSSLGCSGSG